MEVRQIRRVDTSLPETYRCQAIQMPPLRQVFLKVRSSGTPHEETQLINTFSHLKCQKKKYIKTLHHCQKKIYLKQKVKDLKKKVWLIYSQYQMGPVLFNNIFHFLLSHLLCYLLPIFFYLHHCYVLNINCKFMLPIYENTLKLIERTFQHMGIL